VVNGIVSLYRGAIAPANPWGAATLEWATSSPPPVYNFEHIPVVESSTPMWDSDGELPVATGLRVDEKEMLLTTVVAATPDVREPVPEPSLWPFVAACAVGIVFVCSIFSPWSVPFGLIPCGIALTAWFWPKQMKRQPEPVIS
jgi:cytochrome c oxidase subunit 1